MASTLINLSGISLTNNQARNIQQLQAELLDYDKRPLILALYHQPTESWGSRKVQVWLYIVTTHDNAMNVNYAYT